METRHVTLSQVPVALTPINHARSVTLTVWSRCGSRDEQEIRHHGLVHFLEHMVFKGTKDKKATDIARAIEREGGDLDAFTTRDHTCFIAKIPNGQVALGMELLTDLLMHPAFREEDIRREQQVVLEEIRMSKDDPDDCGDEMFMSRIYPERELGRSILGEMETVAGLDQSSLEGMRCLCMRPDNLVVSVAGQFDPDTMQDRVLEFLEAAPNGGSGTFSREAQVFQPFHDQAFRDTMESVNLYAALPTPEPQLKLQQHMAVLSTILGGGMSSRLFRKIREEAGLVYSVFSSPAFFRNEGNLYMNASTSPINADRVMNMMVDEVMGLPDTLTPEEVSEGVTQLSGRFRLALESTSSIALFHGRGLAHYGHPVSLERVLDILRSVTYDDIRELAAAICRRDALATLQYGNIRE